MIVHERASPGLATGKSEIEALRNRNGRQPSSRRADRRNNVGRSLSGNPVFDPLRSLKNATRFIISSRVQLRTAGIMAASP
jgi:hypothetical protein